jgi:hypothetical protein
MKKLLLPLMLVFTLCYCKAQTIIDLEKITYKEDVKILLKDKRKHGDPNEIATTLPEYRIYEVADFSYGPIHFTGKSDPGFGDISSVSFLLNSVTEKKLAGIILNIQNSDEANKLVRYIMQKHGKPIELEPKPKPGKDGMLNGFNNFLWRDIQPGYSLVMANDYQSNQKKQQFFTQIFILRDDQPTAVPTGFKSALDRILKTFTDHHKFE